jgi:FKBP-type peptidyl-prolyl cis-trans isomerase (trigger factor)
MKVDIKKLDACTRQLDIEIGAEIVTGKLDEIYDTISRTAKVPGFRPGQAPRNVLEEHHSKLAQEELLKILIPQTLEKSMQEHSLVPCAAADVSEVSLKDNILRFSAKVEVRPEIKLKEYKGIKIKRRVPQVKDEEIQKQLEALAKDRGRSTIDDNFAKSLGYLTLDELKGSVQKQHYLQAQEEAYHELLNQLLDQLVKDNAVSAPASLVKRQLQQRLQEARYKLKMYGQKEEEIETRIKELQPQLEQACQKDVKIFLLLEEIAKQEKIQAKDHHALTQRTIEFLLENAQWS